MKKRITVILILQLICSALWIIYIGYLSDDYAKNRYEVGKTNGAIELIGDLTERGIVVPDDLRVSPNKSQVVNLGGAFFELLIYYPAIIMQLIVIGLLARVMCTKAGATDKNEAEQVAASDS